MKLIPLTQGKFAMVDDEDFEILMQKKWYAYKSGASFYARRYVHINQYEGYFVQMHRFIMRTPNELIADHIDHNGLNNQKSNLRNCTRSENGKNRSSALGSKSNYLGVTWDKGANKWRARIYSGKRINLGHFKTEEEAAIAYNEAAKIHHKEFANLNVV